MTTRVKIYIDKPSEFAPVFRFEEIVAALKRSIGEKVFKRVFMKDAIEIGMIVGIEVDGSELFAVVKLKST